MKALLEQRKVALSLMHLKRRVSGGTNRKKLSDEKLANLLTGHASSRITARDVNELINWTRWPDASSIRDLLQSIDALAMANGIAEEFREPGFSKWEPSLRKELPEALRDIKDEEPLGEKLGELVTTLQGGWALSYVSPVNRDGQAEAEIRQTLLIFKKADANETEIQCEIISGKSRWHGTGCAHNDYILIQASEYNRTDSVSFIVTRPTMRRLSFIGLGLALQRSATQDPDISRPILSILTFGQKIDKQSENDNEGSLIEKMTEGFLISSAEESRLRQKFIENYKNLDDFFNKYPSLKPYQENATLNDERLSLISMRLEWVAKSRAANSEPSRKCPRPFQMSDQVNLFENPRD